MKRSPSKPTLQIMTEYDSSHNEVGEIAVIKTDNQATADFIIRKAIKKFGVAPVQCGKAPNITLRYRLIDLPEGLSHETLH